VRATGTAISEIGENIQDLPWRKNLLLKGKWSLKKRETEKKGNGKERGSTFWLFNEVQSFK